jgi:tetratricopeptide (TPR) repeat protein
VWTLRDLARRWHIPRTIAAVVAVLLVVASAVTAWTQSSNWRDTETLWTHTLRVAPDSDVAQLGLGDALLKRGDLDGALAAYERALESRMRRRASPHDLVLATIHNNIGLVLQRKGRLDEALARYGEAVEAQPDFVEANANFASALLAKSETSSAVETPLAAARLELESPSVHILRGDVSLRQGAENAAIESYERALTLGSRDLVPLQNLAWLYATSTRDGIRNGVRAQALAESAVRVSGGNNPLVLRTLAAAQAENGDFAGAIATTERALALATDNGQQQLTTELEGNLARFRAGAPLRYTLGAP